MADEHEIDRATFRQGTTQSITELHITGGQRAIERPGRLWSWYPVLSEGHVRDLAPRPIQQIAALANAVGLDLFGGDQQSGLEGPLVSRIWTPLDGPHAGGLQPADLWRAIARNADEAGDTEYALLARHISYSLTAAGIRLRDASDGYHAQLMAAIQSNTRNGGRFSNIPMRDLQLAFHSVLSELASTRDYLAASVALKLGAPAKIDAMNRFKEWVSAGQSRPFSHRPGAGRNACRLRLRLGGSLASSTDRVSQPLSPSHAAWLCDIGITSASDLYDRGARRDRRSPHYHAS